MAYEINYNDDRFNQVIAERDAQIAKSDSLYNDMISQSDSKYQGLINQINQNADKQADIQNQQKDLALEKINVAQQNAERDYLKEQKAAYADYTKESNRFGVNAEQMAATGMSNTGYSESSRVAMYNQYQNRYATARQSLNDTITQFTLASKDAILQNSSALMQIYADAAMREAEYTLQAFQYKNNLLTEKMNQSLQINNIYDARYQNVLQQINTENALQESIRQYNETMAFNKQKQAQDQANWEKEYALQKASLAAKNSSNVTLNGQKYSGTKDEVNRISSLYSTLKGVYDKAYNAASKSKFFNNENSAMTAVKSSLSSMYKSNQINEKELKYLSNVFKI